VLSGAEPVFGVVLLAGMTAVVLWRRLFSEGRAIRHQLTTAPRSRICDVREGVVCVRGKVTFGQEALIAPLSGSRCAAFQLSAPGARRVEPLDVARPFWVDDGTGRALVDPGAHFAMALERRTRARADDLDDDITARLIPVLATAPLGRSWEATMYHEGLMLEGDTVTVGGHARMEPHRDGQVDGPRRLPSCVVLRGGGPHEPLLIGDDRS
jgi:hypothetical protein